MAMSTLRHSEIDSKRNRHIVKYHFGRRSFNSMLCCWLVCFFKYLSTKWSLHFHICQWNSIAHESMSSSQLADGGRHKNQILNSKSYSFLTENIHQHFNYQWQKSKWMWIMTKIQNPTLKNNLYFYYFIEKGTKFICLIEAMRT